MSAEKLYLYPVWIRLWHLVNALFCLSLIMTGISMQFSNPLVPMIRFDIAVSIHNITGILLSINYIGFLLGNLFTGNGRNYKMAFPGLSTRLKSQFHYYIKGIFTGDLPPFPISIEKKFNPLQQFSYVVIMYVSVPVLLVTGWSLMYPEVIPTRFLSTSGLHLTDLLHILIGFIISLFMFVHIYFCTIGKTTVSNFMSIINGYHETH
ncbi:MAG: cytochrome b/b6 domain-containing protein [Bacteroidetes bacterium]|nr:cytochrome b/b6 domain-containing protein [Bacteroidota bacterium]